MQLLTVTCMLLVLSNKGKGMQSSSEQPLVREEHCVTTRITAAKETSYSWVQTIFLFTVVKVLNGSHMGSHAI